MDTDTILRPAPDSRRHTVIVGGGITGLTAALRLHQAFVDAGQPAHITVLEQDQRWGGKIRTVYRDGFIMEGGAEGFVGAQPEAVELCRELGLGDGLVWMDQSGPLSYALRGGRLYPLPQGIAGVEASSPVRWAREGLLSPAGALRLAAEFVVPRRRESGDEAVRDFLVRRFGREACDRLFGPLMRGIAAEGEPVSVDATVPELRQLEQRYGSILRGMRERRRAAEREGRRFDPRVPLGAPAAGMARLVDRLVEHLQSLPGVELRTGVAVEGVAPQPGGFAIGTSAGPLEAAALLLAIPSGSAAALVGGFDAELASELEAIPFKPAATITLAFSDAALRGIPTYGAGYVRAGDEPGVISACTWEARRWGRTMPGGAQTIRLFLREQPEALAASDADLIRLARRDLAEVQGIHAEPLLAEVVRWVPHALPRYPVGHRDRVAAIQAAAGRWPGLALAGASYHGAGVTDCIRDGERAARHIAAALRPHQPLPASGRSYGGDAGS